PHRPPHAEPPNGYNSPGFPTLYPTGIPTPGFRLIRVPPEAIRAAYEYRHGSETREPGDPDRPAGTGEVVRPRPAPDHRGGAGRGLRGRPLAQPVRGRRVAADDGHAHAARHAAV